MPAAVPAMTVGLFPGRLVAGNHRGPISRRARRTVVSDRAEASVREIADHGVADPEHETPLDCPWSCQPSQLVGWLNLMESSSLSELFGREGFGPGCEGIRPVCTKRWDHRNSP
jgi:hypothetical protein